MLAYFECFWIYSCHWDSQGNKLLGSWGIIYCKAKGIPFFSTCLQILRCKTTLRRLFILVMLHIEYPIRYGFNEKPHFVILCFQYVNIEFLNPFFFFFWFQTVIFWSLSQFLYIIFLQTGYLDIWEPATLSIKKEGYNIKCSGPSGVVASEKFSPSTNVWFLICLIFFEDIKSLASTMNQGFHSLVRSISYFPWFVKEISVLYTNKIFGVKWCIWTWTTFKKIGIIMITWQLML